MIVFAIDAEAGDWRDDVAGEAIVRRALDAVQAAGDLPPRPDPGPGPGPVPDTLKGLVSGTEFDLSILLTDDAHMRALNRQWRGVDRPTNVLSFPAEDRVPGTVPRLAMLGDVVVAHETLHREAAAESIRPADHFAHLLIHGVLHLFGHDHDTEAKAWRMEAIEVAALASLGIADPYAHYGATEAGGPDA